MYLPAKRKATGAGVIIMPGGGHRYLSIDNEGHAVARWLSEQGVAGFVLKYRLAREDGSTYKVEEHAVKDAQRALRLVRVARQGVEPRPAAGRPDRVLGRGPDRQPRRRPASTPAARAPATRSRRRASRPAFQALVYGGAKREGRRAPKDAPPAFLCVAADDKGPTGTAVELFQKLREAGVSAELHIFSKGGHGFGMRDRPLAITGWPSRFHEWMADQGFLKSASGRPEQGALAISCDMGGQSDALTRSVRQLFMSQRIIAVFVRPLPRPGPAGRGAPARRRPRPRDLERALGATVRPFLERHCTSCHGGAKPKADLDLRPYTRLQTVIRDHAQWEVLLEKLVAKQMPPDTATEQPSAEPTGSRSSTGSKPCAGARRARTPAIPGWCWPGG